MKKIPVNKSLLIYLLFAVCMLTALCMKKNYHVDELYSYGLSNHSGGLYLQQEEFVKYEPAEEIYGKYLTVDAGERFDYGMVIQNQIDDIHPPLYYLLLHTLCSLFPGVFSNWFAALINVCFALAVLAVFRRILRLLTEDEKICNLISLFFVFSPGILNAVIFFRMYMMAMFFSALFSLQLLERMKKGSSDAGFLREAGLVLTVILAALTHYYCIVYMVLAAMVYGICLLRDREKKQLRIFLASMGIGGAAAYLLFPTMLVHVFRGDKVERSLIGFAEYVSRLTEYTALMGRQLFGGSHSVLLGGLVLAGVLYLLTSGKKAYGLLVIPSLIYLFAVSGLTVYVADRYLYPVYALVMIWGLLLLAELLKRLFGNAMYGRILAGLMIILTIGGYAGFDGGYFYQESEILLENAQTYRETDCVIVYGEEWTLPSLYQEVKNYKSLRFVSEERFEELLDSEVWEEEMILTCVGVDSGTPYFEAVESEHNYEKKKIGSFGYGSSYFYYKKE